LSSWFKRIICSDILAENVKLRKELLKYIKPKFNEVPQLLEELLFRCDVKNLTLQDVSMLRFQLERVMRKYLAPQIMGCEKFGRQAIMGFLKAQLPTVRLVWCFDNSYTVPYSWLWEGLVKRDTVDMRKYISDIYDCENFAFCFKMNLSWFHGLNSVGVLIGETKTGYHAWNCLVGYHPKVGLEVFELEPQTDELGSVEKFSNKGYKPEFVII